MLQLEIESLLHARKTGVFTIYQKNPKISVGI